MSDHGEILARLERSFADAVRLCGATTTPDEFLTVVDLFGEPMTGDPRFRTLSEGRAHDFSRQFRSWLGEMSKQLRHASLDEATAALREAPEFTGQFLVFTTLQEFVDWYAHADRAVLDAYVNYYIDNGSPIFGVSPFMDGRKPKLRRHR